MKIKVLDKNVINQISAGEVVEKPASVVKELVENSIDAGATEITVSIENGGIDKISVIDNGCGINKEEISLAFTPHATSKLNKIDDLNTLLTMGFRGEALATISAVSKVNITTKTKDCDVGVTVNLEGGEQVLSCEVACVTGTKIEVSDLFYNTPARLKFLRKPKSEENDITNYVEKLILSHSHISFKYIINGKIIYNTISGNMLDNVYAIYGKDVATNVLSVDYKIGDYIISGYISKPENGKANRTYQNLFVNNRFCNNSLVSTAVSNTYENFTMKGKFPLYVLFINLPQNEIDVNVHPNKLEVKFVDTKKIYQLVASGIFNALSGYNHIREIDSNLNNNTENILNSNIQNEDFKQEVKTISENEGVSFSNNQDLNNYYKDFINTKNNDSISLFANAGLMQNKLEEDKNLNLKEFTINLSNYEDSKITEKENIINIKKEEFKKEDYKQDDFKEFLSLDYKLVGKVFNTYLLLEFDDKLFMIDQHACHERQRYDELIKAVNNNDLLLQDLLVPYVFKVSQNEATFLLDNLDYINSFGINLSEFGYNTFKVSSVPILLAEINLKNYFDELLTNLNDFSKSPKEILKSKFMQMACKSAIKGGDDLSDKEIKDLLNVLKNTTEVLLCPHGRPIVVEIKKSQIEKWFKRIV